MNGAGIDWTTSLVVLGVGLAFGALLIWKVLAGDRQALVEPEDSPQLRDLEARREVLIQQLRDLEDTEAKQAPGHLARERYELELQAARVLRELDQAHQKATRAAQKAARKAKTPAEPPAPKGLLARNPALKGFVWGAGSIAAVGLLLALVSQSAEQREAGGSVTGNTELMGDATAPHSDEEAQLLQFLERNPDDIEARLALARAYLTRQDMMGVWNETERVLQLAPGEPRALSYQSLVRVAMGQPELALEMLQQALATAPDLFDAHVHLALVHLRLGQPEQAQAAMEQAKARFPDRGDVLDSLWQEMRATPTDPAPATSAENPHEGLGTAPATREAEPPPLPSGGGADTVSGVLELDAARVGEVGPGAVVFLTARAAGGEGPPVAVSRLVADAFPVRFSIGGSHSMMGDALPPVVHLAVRVDSDGDPMTREEADLEASIDDVPLGASGLRLVLR